eukprot:2653407-Amphidinium_carterae.1
MASRATLKLLCYNVCSLLQAGRLAHIATTAQCDVLFLTGLRWRHTDPTCAYSVVRAKTWTAIIFGYGASPFTNRSAGVAIVLSRRIKPKHIVSISAPE